MQVYAWAASSPHPSKLTQSCGVETLTAEQSPDEQPKSSCASILILDMWSTHRNVFHVLQASGPPAPTTDLRPHQEAAVALHAASVTPHQAAVPPLATPAQTAGAHPATDGACALLPTPLHHLLLPYPAYSDSWCPPSW